MSRGMVGREPKKAEADIVVELRATLHTQIRKFLRKHKGGPWNNPKAQRGVADRDCLHRLAPLSGADWPIHPE